MKALRILSAVCVMALLASFAFSADVKCTAKIMDTKGDAEVYLAQSQSWASAKSGMFLCEGDKIVTKSNGWALLQLESNGEVATVEVQKNSDLSLAMMVAEQGTKTQKTLLDLASGEVLIRAQKLQTQESRFEVKTPTSLVGVRGTKFSVKVETL